MRIFFQKYKLDYLLLFLFIFLFSSKFINNINLHGEDEATTYLNIISLYSYLSELDFLNVLKTTLQFHHPPARYYISLPFFLIFENDLWVLRLANSIMWALTCCVIYKISKIVLKEYAFITALLIGCSGLFSVHSLAFGLSGITLFLSLCVYELIKDQFNIDKIESLHKSFLRCNIYLFIAFLFYNTAVLFIFSLYAIFLYYLYKSKIKNKIKSKLTITALTFAIFYIIYYLIFVGIPIYITHFNGLEFINNFFKQSFKPDDLNPWGQYHQYISRSSKANINFDSFIENIKGINWAFFPFLSIIILLTAFIEIFKNYKKIFFLIILKFIVINFFFKIATIAHFLVLYSVIIPFGIKNLLSYFKNFYRTYLIFFIFVSTTYFSYYTQIKIYNEKNYPYILQKVSYGKNTWAQNLERPWGEINEFLNNNLLPNKKIFNAIDEGYQILYMSNLNWVSYKKKFYKKVFKEKRIECLNFPFDDFDVLLTHEKKRDICKNDNLEYIYFKNSLIYLVVKKNSIKNNF
jgi:4-amino-4-deoxy-L-arabinose transferase-like glycosyltransferase